MASEINIANQIPWMEVIGWILVSLLVIIATFVMLAYNGLKDKDKEVDGKITETGQSFVIQIKEAVESLTDGFGEQIKEVKKMFEGLSKNVGDLNSTLQKHEASYSGINKRLDDQHEEQTKMRTRLHDLENFQTRIQVKEDIEKRREAKT